MQQVKPNDVIFLFKRGGSGYVGAFRAKDPSSKILYSEKSKEYSDDDLKNYDIYDGLAGGASLCSNILVEPIAYNYVGIGYQIVRRRTIERITDMEAVRFLLNRFNGNDLDDKMLIGKGKLNDETEVKLDEESFSKIIEIMGYNN